MPIIDRYIGLLEWVHKVVFSVPMGDKTHLFVRQLHWSIIGGIISSGVIFGVSIMAGRVLGASQYGRYSFVLAFTQVVALAITWGFELAIVRALAFTQGDKVSQRFIVSSAIFFVCITATIVNGIILSLPIPYITGAIMTFATVVASKMVLDAMMRGLGLFQYQAMGKIAEAVVVAISFLALFSLGKIHSYVDYMYVILAGGIVLLCWYAVRLVSLASLQSVSYSAFQVLWSYGSRALLIPFFGAILGFITKFIIRDEVGYEFLGQFTVYSMVSISALSFVGGLIMNVFFPIAVQEGYSDEMWGKIHRIAVVGWLPLWISGSVAVNTAIMLYGHEYYLSWWFGIGMAGVAVMQFISGMYWWVIASSGVNGIRYMAINSAIAGSVFIVILMYVVPYNPLFSIIIGYTVASLYSGVVIRLWKVVLVR